VGKLLELSIKKSVQWEREDTIPVRKVEKLAGQKKAAGTRGPKRRRTLTR